MERQEVTEIVHQAVSREAKTLPGTSMRSAHSPRQKISQQITDLSLTDYLRAGQNSLYLISDLLEGNPAAFDSMCEPAGRATENFRLARRGGMEQPAFVNTHIYLHLVPRQDIAPQTLNCRDRYWRWLLADTTGAGAGVSIEYLPSSTRSSSNE